MSDVRIRKIVDYTEDTLIEGGREVETPIRMAACAAIIRNPWGSDYVEDLQPQIMAHAVALADALVPRLIALMADPTGSKPLARPPSRAPRARWNTPPV